MLSLVRGHNHGPVWRRKTEEIGAEPDSGKAGIPVPGKYQLECPSCGEIYHFHRQVMKRKACGRCCNMHSNGKFSNQFELKEVDMKEKPVFIKVEITPDEHKKAKIKALESDTTLQKWVGQLIRKAIKKS